MSRRWLVFGLAAALALGGYLWWAAGTYRIGFPLDDAWIHQTYARSLARGEGWAFLPGQPSAGSTAPLWSLALSIGHRLDMGPYLWTYLLGWAALAGLALAGHRAAGAYGLPGRGWPWAIGLFLAFEWHLVWAAGSGMETLPYALLAAILLVQIGNRRYAGFSWGILIGLGAWLRPDALTLLGPAGWALLFRGAGWQRKRADLSLLLAGAALPVGIYLLFNFELAGRPLPNTFFAKQAEYAVLQNVPIGARLIEQLSLTLVGPGALLLPGFVVFVWRAIRKRRWDWLAGPLWYLGYAGLYAWRLPVVYQHGRYLIPAMPVYFICGLIGMAWWVQGQGTRRRWILSRVWALSTALVLLAFWFQGGMAYGRDVAVIESEMVATALWVAGNTPEDALIAAHDIGALGYFAGRDLLDLAGLVSPEVIPFIRDEPLLADHLSRSGAAYLVTLQGWYPLLEGIGSPVFRSDAPYSPALGGTNMVVYAWPGDGG